MLNSYTQSSHSTRVNINAVSGLILKNHPKSWFSRFHLQSRAAECRLCESGNKDIVVLQMLICGDMEVIAELVRKEDLESGDEE